MMTTKNNQEKIISTQILHPLTPKKDSTNSKNYKKYFDYALKNDDIKNIALSGNYGSGKSSILKTYFGSGEYKDKYLQVSLATFSENIYDNKTEENQFDNNSNSNQLNLEKDIINQILYQIPIQRIPLTNFRIKRELNSIQKILIIIELFITISLILPINFITQHDFTNIKLFFLLMLISWNLWSLLKYLPIKKINFKHSNLELEISKQNDELFEKYSDEIIYILEKSKKNILIIEDLDRFNQLKIFEKLRELNIKLNNIFKDRSNEKFVFIYAVKDDLFKEYNERTKFFDLIIPVIPFVSYENSYEQMSELFGTYSINKQLLLNLSYFIFDMRTLYNIYNEFIVFTNELQNEDKNNLLALMVYKNLYNLDFEKLKNREGLLYQIITSVDQTKLEIKSQISNLQEELQKLIEESEQSAIKNEKDLFRIWFSKHFNNSDDLKQSDNYVENPNKQFYASLDYSTSLYSYEIVKNVPEYKIELDKINKFPEKKKKLEEEIYLLKDKLSYKIKDIVQEYSSTPQSSFIYRMIKLGFIDENYSNCLNYYYGNKNDSDFILNIFKNKQSVDFNLELNDFDKILNTLVDQDYNKPSILNFSFLTYLIEHSQYEKVNSLLEVGYLSIHNNFLELYYNDCYEKTNIYKIFIDLIKQYKYKLDLTQLSNIDDMLIDNNLFIENDGNYNEIISKNWNSKLDNPTKIEKALDSKTFLNKEFLNYFISKLTTQIDLDRVNDKFFEVLIKDNKVIPSGKNINLYYHFIGQVDNNITSFINKNDIKNLEDLDKSLVSSLINNSELVDEKYMSIFKNCYNKLGVFTFSDIEAEISANKLQILVSLDLVKITEELIQLLEKKKVHYIEKNENVIAKLLLDNKDFIISNLSLILNSLSVSLSDRRHIFIDRIDYFEYNDAKSLVQKLQFDNKIIKVFNRTTNFFNLKIEKNDENTIIFNYLLKKHMITQEQFDSMLYDAIY